MRRPVLVASGLLAALTALALLGAAVTTRPPGLPAEADGPQEAANRSVADAFYAAANAAIAAGDTAPLTALVAPDFVDHDAPPDVEPDRDGLLRRLLAVHAAAPSVRLMSQAVTADGDLVIAHVRVSGATNPQFVGLHLSGAWSAWGPVDVLRVAAGRIIERRGEPADPILPVPLLRVPLDVPPPAARTLEVARVTLPPGTRYDAPRRSGPRVVYVEVGTVAVAAGGPEGAGAARPALLNTGEHLVLPPSAGFAALQTGPASAVLLDLAVVVSPHVNQPAASATPSPEDGVRVEVIADALWVAVPAGRMVLAVGRVTLGPNERFGWAAAAGPVLLRVEAGTLDLVATGSVPWVGGAVSERSTAGVEAALGAGGGALLDAGAAAEVRTGRALPATLLVVTLQPDEGPSLDGVAMTTVLAS